MNAWMDGWMDGWLAGWLAGCMAGRPAGKGGPGLSPGKEGWGDVGGGGQRCGQMHAVRWAETRAGVCRPCEKIGREVQGGGQQRRGEMHAPTDRASCENTLCTNGQELPIDADRPIGRSAPMRRSIKTASAGTHYIDGRGLPIDRSIDGQIIANALGKRSAGMWADACTDR